MRGSPGNDLPLGLYADTGTAFVLPASSRAKHLYCVGSTGTGKSKFLESLLRRDIASWRKHKCGVLLIDPHGSLYDSLISWAAWLDRDWPIVPIDLRRDDWVVAYNVLRKRSDMELSVVVDQIAEAIAYVWGASGMEMTPLLAQWTSNILGTLYEKELTLVQAEHLIDRFAVQMRRALTEDLQQPMARQDWAFANTLKPVQFSDELGSTIRRLRSFISKPYLRRMFGQTSVSLDLGKAMEEGQIILISLATEGGRVSDDDAQLFATLLLNDLWMAAKHRGKNPNQKPFYVYCDEFQDFVTPTMAKNLDQARGFGLHLTLAHQFPKQLLNEGAHGIKVWDSIMANARTKAVFSVEGEDNLRPLALSLFMGMMSPDKIKHELYSTKVMGYREEWRTVRSTGNSSGHGKSMTTGYSAGQGVGGTDVFAQGESTPTMQSTSASQFAAESGSTSESESEASSESESEVPIMVPIFGQELSSVQFESLEEQLFRAMAILHDQQERHFLVRREGTKNPAALRTPTVESFPASKEMIEAYRQKLLKKVPFCLPAEQAELRLKEQEEQLNAKLANTTALEPISARRKVPPK